jgi:hypothetical protein
LVVGIFRIGVAITLSRQYNLCTLTQVVYVLFSLVILNGTFTLVRDDFSQESFNRVTMGTISGFV